MAVIRTWLTDHGHGPRSGRLVNASAYLAPSWSPTSSASSKPEG